MMETMSKTFEETVRSDFYGTIAKAYRKLYLELIAENFTEEQAMAICTSQGLGLKP